jgi:hypothetical protein
MRKTLRSFMLPNVEGESSTAVTNTVRGEQGPALLHLRVVGWNRTSQFAKGVNYMDFSKIHSK